MLTSNRHTRMDNRKKYHADQNRLKIILQRWIIDCLNKYKLSGEVINFIVKTMKTWKVELTAGRKTLTEVKIQRCFFQGDVLSSLIFIIAIMPLNHILRKCICGYKLHKSEERINHLIYMEDIKLFVKNEKELETLIQAVRIYSDDKGIKFCTEKCAMLIIKSRKRQMTERRELPNRDEIRTLEEKETYKCLGILKVDTRYGKIKKKIENAYPKRTRKLLETKPHSRKLIKYINTWSVPFVRYSGPFLKLTRKEVQQMDQRTRKLTTNHKALYPRHNTDRMRQEKKVK